MAALIPAAQPSNVEAAYEDMFKEITRKLYGEETGNGLHTLGTPVAQVATTGPTAPEGERSFTTLMSDRNLAPTIEYDHNGVTEPTTTSGGNFKSEDHLTTAFGLAALMQNGFATTGAAILNSQTLIKSAVSDNNQSGGNNGNSGSGANSEQDARWSTAGAGTSSEEIVQWPTSGKLSAFVGGQKQMKNLKNREHAGNEQMFNNQGVATGSNINTPSSSGGSHSRKSKNPLNNVNGNNDAIGSQTPSPKRYGCTHCPYSTDRRDLYTRHENIHKDEKPFQCYACLKQFNRADHVKKHFLRMHRELSYDINKTRRNIVSSSNQSTQQAQIDQKPIIFGLQNANNAQVISDNFLQQPETASSLSIAQTIESVATASSHAASLLQMKQEKMSTDDKSPVKIKKEKRFTCCYCPWSGADKWGLKRHLNTHTKPFVCMLCDYKAARSERLATHVLKVHNKRACNKCSFLADSQEEYQIHLNDVHPHDQRPPRSGNSSSSTNNSNVLRTISNNLVSSNQINNFQNPSTSFGGSTGNGVTIYTNNDLSVASGGGNIPLQEIIVNPASMMGWRLSANGTLIPPDSNSTNQKRGAERLFQYLEADGSDPEDYARQLKMDAISRNTASVAQDFHNAGGVDLKFEHHFKKTEAANRNPNHHRYNNHSQAMDWDGDSSDSESSFNSVDHKEAMSIFLSKNFQLKENTSVEPQQRKQLEKSSPALKSQSPSKNNNNNNNNQHNHHHTTTKGHRLGLVGQNKENANSMFSGLENFNLAKFESQFQNYVKEVINKYYSEAASSPCVEKNAASAMMQQFQQKRSETEEYIEYLKNKEDITLTITSKKNGVAGSKAKTLHSLLQSRVEVTAPPVTITTTAPKRQQQPTTPPAVELTSPTEKRKNRKQAQPKKIKTPPEVVISLLRDKYLNNMVKRKRTCITCTNSRTRTSMLSFPYHSVGSLALHRFWKHSVRSHECKICRMQFTRPYSLAIHHKIKHRRK